MEIKVGLVFLRVINLLIKTVIDPKIDTQSNDSVLGKLFRYLRS